MYNDIDFNLMIIVIQFFISGIISKQSIQSDPINVFRLLHQNAILLRVRCRNLNYRYCHCMTTNILMEIKAITDPF